MKFPFIIKLTKLIILIFFIISFASCKEEVYVETVEHEITLHEGWNIWSTYINTTDPVLYIL